MLEHYESWKSRYDSVFNRTNKRGRDKDKKVDHDELNDLLLTASSLPLLLSDECQAITNMLDASSLWVHKVGSFFTKALRNAFIISLHVFPCD